MHIISSITVLFWAGFVSSISFMEAWLKFRAEGVTQTTGLSIGKKVFTAMNRMEWVFLIMFVLSLNIHGITGHYPLIISAGTVVLLLAWQTIHLLPSLNKRAVLIINGSKPGKKSSVHLLYGIAEILKVASLLIAGYLLYY
ncbi:MAG TPA: hypothetical protein VE912_15500 [Bacteroidales bacterium]|nr:hypothetical protein [Bacteroidales bacterium]